MISRVLDRFMEWENDSRTVHRVKVHVDIDILSDRLVNHIDH